MFWHRTKRSGTSTECSCLQYTTCLKYRGQTFSSLACRYIFHQGKLSFHFRHLFFRVRLDPMQKLFRKYINYSGLTVYILLGPPGRAQVFPYLSPGPLDFLVVCKKRINHSRVATNTRPTECPHSHGE